MPPFDWASSALTFGGRSAFLPMGLDSEMEHASRTDDDLALALQAGDMWAFDELVRRHQGRVYAVAYRMTSNREDARDVAQEALLRAYRKIGQWRPGAGFVPWLMRLTVNQAIDHLRRERRRPRSSWSANDGNEAETLSAAALAGPGAQMRAREIGDRVQGALEVLSVSQRAVFVMRHYEGMQLNEIAAALGCTVGSVKVHLFRALRKMQAELSDFWNDTNA